jgi:hypothetical protein
MEKYKRFSEELADNDAIQKFLNDVTTEGWEIIYYNEREFGGMGMVKVTIVGRIKQQVL